ncbi:MAG TPA: T9SS type A sorting domain-containing protein [Candidatus Krumholzibacteria bacterium]|nr:T9SS type A sorting domain-containing protein [Candidatus Krumholzibacteria bacterium]
MFRRFLVLLSLTAFFAIALGAVAPAQHELKREFLGAGGRKAVRLDRELRHSVGQPITGRSSRPELIVRHGFWAKKNSGTATAVLDPTPTLPKSTRLDQNHPNPFNPRTTISYALPADGHVLLSLYDVRGRRVATLVNQDQSAGEHSLVFAPNDLASGVYFYQLKAPGFEQVRRLVLAR